MNPDLARRADAFADTEDDPDLIGDLGTIDGLALMVVGIACFFMGLAALVVDGWRVLRRLVTPWLPR
jgi:hypothetical protein